MNASSGGEAELQVFQHRQDRLKLPPTASDYPYFQLDEWWQEYMPTCQVAVNQNTQGVVRAYARTVQHQASHLQPVPSAHSEYPRV